MAEIAFRLDVPFLVTFGLLIAAIASLWLPMVRRLSIPWLLLTGAVAAGFYWRFLEPASLAAMGGLLFCHTVLNRYQHNAYLTGAVYLAVIAMSIALMLHMFPGFNNPVVLGPDQLSGDSLPYRMYANFDKGMLAFFLIVIFSNPARQEAGAVSALRTAILPTLATITLIIGLGMAFGFVRLDIKWFSFFWIWMPVNLVLVCAAEEALFRGFIQRSLASGFSHIRHGDILALCLASILFGIAHFPGGLPLVILAALAGFGYGWIFIKTKRIEASILAHFSLNLVHVTLFSYPALALL